MKLTHFIAAGLLMVGIGVSTEASAQRWDGQGRSQEYRGDRGDRNWNRGDNRRWDRGDNRRWDRRDNRRWDRHRGWDRGRHHGWDRRWDRRGYGWNGGRHCRTVWRYGQRYRVCR